MILSGKEIKRQLGKGLSITPFSDVQLNPNSYNLKLHNKLIAYTHCPISLRAKQETKELLIPDSGITLYPGKLYLGRTVEYTETTAYVPMLEGRSSIGRAGISIHVTAGFGDIGFKGFWTLEIYCIEPVILIPFIEICQIYYHTILGDYTPYTSGKYQGNTGIQPSLLYTEIKK